MTDTTAQEKAGGSDQTGHPAAVHPSRCNQCGRDRRQLFVCEICHTLFPEHAHGVDHFTMLQLPRTYDLDGAQIEKAFFEQSRKVHPDAVGSRNPTQLPDALTLSSRVNEAYRVISDPVTRADYLLEVSGGPSCRQDKSVSQELLMEVLELRETIEQADASPGHGTLPDELVAVRDRANQLRSDTVSQIDTLARLLPDDMDDGDRNRLRQLLNAVSYLDNILARVHT